VSLSSRGIKAGKIQAKTGFYMEAKHFRFQHLSKMEIIVAFGAPLLLSFERFLINFGRCYWVKLVPHTTHHALAQRANPINLRSGSDLSFSLAVSVRRLSLVYLATRLRVVHSTRRSQFACVYE
jgi:hypothetical protein